MATDTPTPAPLTDEQIEELTDTARAERDQLRAVAEAATAFIAAWEREADNVHTAADLHATLDALLGGA